MRTFSLSFFLGTLVLLLLARLPVAQTLGWATLGWAVALLLCGYLARRMGWRQWGTVLLAGLGAGALYALLVAGNVRDGWLPEAWEEQDIVLTGTVADVPERGADGLHFLLAVDAEPFSGNLRLAWYEQDAPEIRAGERWQLVVRGKRPNGFMNPNGFDYEQWLFTQRTAGSGYVRASSRNQRLAEAPWLSANGLRQSLQERIGVALGGSPMTGVVQGLAVAYTQAITPQQWAVFRKTGITHLLAISGLHITMVASAGLLPVMLVWYWLPGLYLRMPLRIAGGMVGGVLAVGYSLLAGMNIPTQRTLIMLLVMMVGLVWRRQIPFSVTMSLALLLVLLLDPLAPLSVGFWLSFLSVSLVVFLGVRQRKLKKSAGVLMQVVLSLGTVPLTAGFFGMVSLVSPLANLLAIPWVTFVVTPLILLGVLLTGVWPLAADSLWQLAGWLLEGLMWVLEWLAGLPLSAVYLPLIPWGWIALALLGFLLLWLPRGMPGRWLGGLLMLPLVLYQPERPAEGSFQVGVLDVGQGLASVVETAHHTLVFDTGPKASDSFDTGALVLLPWLHGQGVTHVDRLMVSHADNDHSGGGRALLAEMPVTDIWVSDRKTFPELATVQCVAGQQWEWDGVRFTVLHPSADFVGESTNNRACVLKVENQWHSILFTADIERLAEYWLLKQDKSLAAEVLLIPHHGSKTSSSPAFIEAVAPRWGIITSGYLNRFHHPQPSVVERYRARGIGLLNSADTGALMIQFPASAQPLNIGAWREQQRHLWNK